MAIKRTPKVRTIAKGPARRPRPYRHQAPRRSGGKRDM